MCGFIDESGTDPSSRCYSIGCLIIKIDSVDDFNVRFQELATQHGVFKELHWTKLANSHGVVNIAIDLLIEILSRPFSYHAMVVNKVTYKKWNTRKANKRYREDAYYQTLTLLIRYCAESLSDDYIIYCDERPDKYPLQREVSEKISNNLLRMKGSDARISAITSNDSKLVPAIQACDILTGAINLAHAKFLQDKPSSISVAKSLCIARLASVLGWKDLCCDTKPGNKFNIWHFPDSWRANPETREIAPSFSKRPYITNADIEYFAKL